jgi:hypothetical protein
MRMSRGVGEGGWIVDAAVKRRWIGTTQGGAAGFGSCESEKRFRSKKGDSGGLMEMGVGIIIHVTGIVESAVLPDGRPGVQAKGAHEYGG